MYILYILSCVHYPYIGTSISWRKIAFSHKRSVRCEEKCNYHTPLIKKDISFSLSGKV